VSDASELPPLESLYDTSSGAEVPLPPELARVYGPLRVPRHADRPHVISNFVSTLDGVVSWNTPGKSGGGEISGFNAHDRLLMGLLRAVADAVVIGAGTLRSVPRHLWTAEHVYRPLADTFRELRARLGKSPAPLNVIVTSQGRIDLSLPVFRSDVVPALIVTAPAGEEAVRAQPAGASVRIVTGRGGNRLTVSAGDVLDAIGAGPGGAVLVEGGPQLLADFLAEERLDELFLTLSPQIAGRDRTVVRPSLVEGKLFAPEAPLWANLTSLKRGGNHLFMRYGL
jgi:riboflavin biosynthesis pyrimidine reductase